MKKEAVTEANKAVNMKYYIIEGDTLEFRRIDPKPLNNTTFFDIYAYVFSAEQIEAENIPVISFENGEVIDDREVGRGPYAVEIMDQYTLGALEAHYDRFYRNIMQCETQRNDYVALQQSKLREAERKMKGKQLSIFSS